MKLSKIKAKQDKYLTKYIIQERKLLRELLNLNKNTTLFYLGYFCSKDFFLYKNHILISGWSAQNDENNNFMPSTMKIDECYMITLLKDFPQCLDDIKFETIIKYDNTPYTAENFLEWIDRPCNITEKIDLPFYKIISFLQKYKSTNFKSKNYLFYTKQDKDFSWTLNIYAKNLKTKKEIKLYFPDKYLINTKDIVIDSLSTEISNYEKLKCKKEYLEFSKIYCKDLETINHYALELLKEVFQPVEHFNEICVHRIFSKVHKENLPKRFTNIWVLDFPKKNEEPCFFLTDHPLFNYTNKIAMINFKNPTYHIKTYFKQGASKYKRWIMEKEYLKELIEFLKSPVDLSDIYNLRYGEYVKTNWQQLIFEYNYNTAGWNIDEPEDLGFIEILPFNLPMPDYLKLLEDK